jgi:hypothetical protein
MTKKKQQVKKGMTRGQYIGIGIIAAVIAAIGVGVFAYIQNPPETAQFGAVGSTHKHAVMLVMINGKQVVDFSEPKYQVQSDYIHLESRDGYTVHMHATNVNLGYLFKTLGMEFTSDCLTLDNGTSYCNDGTNTLKFYVNGEKNDAYDKYVFKDEDRILISYGPEDPEQINRELDILENIQLRG